jgi:predicted enzyme related to lactoylglutathione lyase
LRFTRDAIRRFVMATVASPTLGRPVWYELMTTDLAAAEKFYGAVVGWSSAPSDNSPNPYKIFSRSGQVQVAGLMTRPGGMNMPPFWSMYVAVPKLEDAVAQIKRLGGSELSGVIDVPTVGRMQMLKDPQGAAFYIIQPAPRDERPESAPQIGEASWHELMTTDAAAAMKFYSHVFGWRPTESVDMGPMGKYQMFNRPHGMIGGMMNTPPDMAAAPPMWTIYFRVPDINEAAARIKANGGTITNGPQEVPGGDWIVNAVDPEGAHFALHAKKA